MTFLALSDIHGAYDAASHIIESRTDASAVILAGDLTTRGTAREAGDALRNLGQFGKSLYVVAGNMDPPELEEVFSSVAVTLNGRGVVVGNVGLFGVSGSPFTPMHTPYEISEEEIERRAEAGWSDVAGASLTIFVPHAPPHGTSLDRILIGRHAGSTAVRTFIERHSPTVTVCGHIHEARGVETVGSTVVVNCGPAGKGYAALITTKPGIRVELLG